MNSFYTTTIKKIDFLTRDAVNIELLIPLGHEKIFRFKSGQNLVIRIPALGSSVHRSYSISAAPYENKLQIGVKKQEGGMVSTYLIEKAKDGESIDIMPPQGSFTLDHISGNIHSIVAFCAGSGITPVISIIKEHLQKVGNKALLIYGNKTMQDRMYISELNQLESSYPIQFEDLYIYSRQQTGMNDLEGRIDTEKLKLWKDYLFEIHKVDAFLICGPGGMVVSLEEELKNLGVPATKIITELFTAPIAAISHDLNPTEIRSGGFNLQYKLNNSWHAFQVSDNNEVILDIGMNHGLDLPYSCKSGVCSTCQAKLLEGEVKMDNNYVLSDSELKQGYILTCQSHAMTQNIKIDYDMK